jgi:hypothetical protein
MMRKFLLIILTALIGLMTLSQGHAQTVVQGSITSDTTWSSDVLLRGPVFVRAPATLTVNAGVTVFGEKASLAALIVDRGAKLVAIGTENNPVVFTSDQPSDSRQRADWGGLIINGYSTLNVAGGTKEGEGDTGVFGCSGADCNEADNSGTFRYVRVEYGGIQFSPDNELNGIAFQGVGSGTTVDHVQVAYSKDDGVEFFGGTCNLKYVLITATGDDSLDWTDGWRGNGQFIVVQQLGDEADRGIEADNLDKANDATPRSNPVLYNMTIVGDPDFGTDSTHGMTLRRGTAGNIRNSIVMGFKRSGIDIDSLATFQQAQQGNLIVDNNIFWNNNPNFDSDATDKELASLPFTTAQFMTTIMRNNKEVDPRLGKPYDTKDPDFRPQEGSPAIDGTVPVAAPPQGNTFIVATDFIGAVSPDDDWTRKPWTTYGASDRDGDGVKPPLDCDDDNPNVYPGAQEICDDGIDNNCNGQVDEGCNCLAEEICDNGIDDDCNGLIDDGCSTSICPATRVLGSGNPQLDILRHYRDAIMAKSLKGRIYTKLYYAYGEQVSAILDADPALKAQAAALLISSLPTVEAALTSKPVVLTDAQKQQILAVLDKIGKKSSPGLRLVILKLKSDIQKGSIL